MRLHRVRLRNFRGVTESDVSFSQGGVTIVEGPNEVGKTSISEALELAIDVPDSSRSARVRSVKPVDRDEGPEVEITLSSGKYHLVYQKRWLRNPQTDIKVTLPQSENLTGRDAHDRLKAILGDTLDEDLWRALRIEQGTELTLPLFSVPSMGRALDIAAGGDLATGREDDLWGRIGEEYDKYWTPTGQTKTERKSSQSSVKEAQSKVDELKKRLDDIDSDADEMSRLVTEESRLVTTRAEYEQRESELIERWESTQSLRNKAERLTAVYNAAEAERDSAASAQDHRQGLIDALDGRNKALAALKADAEQAAPALAAAIRHSEKSAADLNDARAALLSAENTHRQANEDRDYLRQKIDVAQLKERHERYAQAAEALKEAEDYLDSARVDDELAGRIEQAYLDHERAKAAADSAAASVETTALRDITVHVGDEEVELAAGEVNRTLVDDEVVLVIPNIARMRVSAGLGSKEPADRRSSTQENFRRLCDEGGVADLAEARTAARQRQEAQRNREEAIKAIDRDLRDLTPEVLLSKVKGLSKRIASYPQERPGDPPLPSDYDTARRIAEETERSVTDYRDEHHVCEDAAKNAAAALQKAQGSENVLAARIKDAHTSKEDAASRLAAARDNRADEALTEALVVAKEKAEDTHKSLKMVEAELNAADPDSLETLLENAREATRRATKELQSSRERQNELRISLDLRGEQGLHTLHDDALNRLQNITRQHERTEARAKTARLLQETFAKRRQQARQRYIGPFKQRIDQFGQIVFGPAFAVELDDDLRVVRRTLDGTTLDVDQLSTGAREQLGVLSRLACAAIVSPDDGGAPVMIDDALGWSDPQRLQSMGAAIAAAGKQCQIIVLTCTPGRYSHVGNAHVTHL